MPTDWYFKNGDASQGPINSTQLKALAAKALITPKTLVRKGKLGDWTPASRVKGLFEPSSPRTTGTTAMQATTPEPTAVTSSDDQEGTVLLPHRNVRRRVIALVALVGFVFIGPSPLYQKIPFALSMLLIFGAYPIVRVTRRHIEQTIIVGFYPVHKKRWPLRDFMEVETEMEEAIYTKLFGILVLFFWVIWLMFHIFNYLMPWMGGKYKLFLKQVDDERLQIWQGNNDSDYETNRDILESAVKRFGLQWKRRDTLRA